MKQIMDNSFSEKDFRKSVIKEFYKRGNTKRSYQNFDETLDAVLSLLKICVDFFILEISNFKTPHDILSFLNNYDASDKFNQGDIAFKHLCKSIFAYVPKMRLYSNEISFLPYSGAVDISDLMGIHCDIMYLTQIYGILITYQTEIGTLCVSDENWMFSFINDKVAEDNQRFQLAVTNGALRKYSDDDFIAETFIEKYRDVFKPIEDQLYNQLFNRTFIYDCNSISEEEFTKMVSNSVPQKGVIEVTDIVLANYKTPFIKGLIYEEDNSDLYISLTKPHNKKYRTRFRPLIQIFIDDTPRYFTTQSIYFEAMSEIGGVQYAHNELPEEWMHIQELKKYSKILFKKHSDLLEENVASLLENEYFYLKNVTSLANTSCEKAPAVVENRIIPKKKVGEIDFIIIDDHNQIIYVADAKFLKPTFYYPSFAVDADKFRKTDGYETKMDYKTNWVSANKNLLASHIRKKEVINYSVEGLFITDNLVYYSLMSKYPIIPISQLISFLNSRNRLCFLPDIIFN